MAAPDRQFAPEKMHPIWGWNIAAILRALCRTPEEVLPTPIIPNKTFARNVAGSWAFQKTVNFSVVGAPPCRMRSRMRMRENFKPQIPNSKFQNLSRSSIVHGLSSAKSKEVGPLRGRCSLRTSFVGTRPYVSLARFCWVKGNGGENSKLQKHLPLAIGYKLSAKCSRYVTKAAA
jgi:hypothetical protein